MTTLTPHFTLEEFCASQTASRLGIDNSLPATLQENAIKTCLGLERVRLLLNANAIRISSGYRSESLEKVICNDAYSQWCLKHSKPKTTESWLEYFATKAHSKALAADFTSTFGSPKVIVQLISGSSIKFDQLIWEYGETGWTHISFSDNPRRQVLTVDKLGTRAFT